jgi:hypothetical protein
VASALDGTLSGKSLGNIKRLLGDKTMHLDDWTKLGQDYKGLSDEQATRKFAHEFFADEVAPKRQGIALEGMPQSRFRGSAEDIPGVNPLTLGQSVKEGMIPLKGVFTGKRPADEFTEAMFRGGAYLERRLQGASRAEARAKTRATFVDYSDLTNFERQYIRPWMPFYSFAKGAAKKLANALYENPGFAIKDGKVVGRHSVAIRAQHEATAQELPLPSYVGQTGAIPWGELESGDRRYITSLGLMHEDPLAMFGAGPLGMAQEVLSRANPLPKFIVEAVTGESLFQRGPLGGRELSEADPTLGRLLTNLGLREEVDGRAQPVIGQTFEHLLANAPGSRLLTTLRTLTDPRKRLGDTVLPGEALIPALTGLRLTDVSPAAQDIAIQQHRDRLAKDLLGARMFQKTYIPEEQQARLRSLPDTADQYSAYQQLGRIRDKNYQRRKRQEAAKRMLEQATAP